MADFDPTKATFAEIKAELDLIRGENLQTEFYPRGDISSVKAAIHEDRKFLRDNKVDSASDLYTRMDESVYVAGAYINAAANQEERAERVAQISAYVAPENPASFGPASPDTSFAESTAIYAVEADKVSDLEFVAMEAKGAVLTANTPAEITAAFDAAKTASVEAALARDAMGVNPVVLDPSRDIDLGIRESSENMALAAERGKVGPAILQDALDVAVHKAVADERVEKEMAGLPPVEYPLVPPVVGPALSVAADPALLAGLPAAINNLTSQDHSVSDRLLAGLDAQPPSVSSDAPSVPAAPTPATDLPTLTPTTEPVVTVQTAPTLAVSDATTPLAPQVNTVLPPPPITDPRLDIPAGTMPATPNRIDTAAIEADLAAKTFKYSGQESVARLQAALNQIKPDGAPDLDVDGDMGGKTRTALAALTPERIAALSLEDRAVIKAATGEVGEIPFEKPTNKNVGALTDGIVKAVDAVGSAPAHPVSSVQLEVNATAVAGAGASLTVPDVRVNNGAVSLAP